MVVNRQAIASKKATTLYSVNLHHPIWMSNPVNIEGVQGATANAIIDMIVYLDRTTASSSSLYTLENSPAKETFIELTRQYGLCIK